MERTFSTRSMIFTLYGDYISQYGDVIWIGSLISLLKEFGHNEQSVRAAVSRMNKQGWLISKKQGNKSYYYLSEQGKLRMDEAAKRIYNIEPPSWDGKWRMLMYSIPEAKRHIRDELRKELVWSGFGLISHSSWITPNPLEKEAENLIEKYDIKEHVHLFEAHYHGFDTDKNLVSQCWDLEEVNDKYSEFIEEYSQKYIIDKSRLEQGSMTDAQCFVERTLLVHEYRKFLFKDPSLPKDLLPEDWLGNSAALLFRDYYRLLKEPATRFFEKTFDSGGVTREQE